MVLINILPVTASDPKPVWISEILNIKYHYLSSVFDYKISNVNSLHTHKIKVVVWTDNYL